MNPVRSSGPARASIKPTIETLSRNAILVGLSSAHAAAVIEGSALVQLPVRNPIYQPDEAIVDVYFPIDAVLSIVTRMKDGGMIEVGTIGREGTSAIPLILGATTTANESYCQVPGVAIKIGRDLFDSLREDEEFGRLLDRYVQAYVNMLGQLAACNRLHNVYERCSRWLLMSHDRVSSSEIRLTHEYLAMMLGTQRSGVTIAAATLKNAGFISYARGVISILDRQGLEGASCECYDVAREQFGGLLRPFNMKNRSVALASAAKSSRKSRRAR